MAVKGEAGFWANSLTCFLHAKQIVCHLEIGHSIALLYVCITVSTECQVSHELIHPSEHFTNQLITISA